jgi:hypothetical protein
MVAARPSLQDQTVALPLLFATKDNPTSVLMVLALVILPFVRFSLLAQLNNQSDALTEAALMTSTSAL